MKEHLPKPGWRSRWRCHERDVLEAFRATGQGIRIALKQAQRETMSTTQAAYIADRLREQRELVRQILQRRHWSRAKRLLRINSRLRERFLALIGQTNLPIPFYDLRCKKYGGSLSIP